MKINENYKNLEESYLFSTIAKKVDEYTKAHPEAKVIKMGIGDVTLPICQKAADAFAKAAMEQGKAATFHGYGPEQGYDFLRVAVQKYYASFQVEVAAEDIFISDGAKSDVGNILDLFDADNTVLIPDPVYPVYMDTNVMAGRKIVFMDANVENGFLPMPPKGQKADIIYLCSPNNPTGNSLSKEELHEILSFIPRETAIVIDEAYASFSNKDTSYIKPLIEEFPNLLIIRTLSKFYGLPGLRLGFAFIGKNLSSFLNYSTKYLGYNRLSEEIGIAVLKANDYYQNVADLMAEDRETYMREIGALEGFKVYHSEANFILVKYPISLKSQLQNAFKAKDLIIKFMNEEDINTHMRITLGTQKQNRLVIDTIKEVVSTPS